MKYRAHENDKGAVSQKIRWIISAVLALLICTACSTEQKSAEEVPVQSSLPEVSACPEPVPYMYEFQLHVLPEAYIQIYGEDFEREFHAFCDAVSKGQDSFPCSSDEEFHRMMSTARTCFPFALNWVDEDLTEVRNGQCFLSYKGSAEEARQDYQRFVRKVTETMTAAVPYDEPSWITAAELLTYIAHKDTFDEEHTLNDMLETGPYRAIMQDTGICQEIAGEYAYYLMQAGINAFLCSSLSADLSNAHEWVMAEFDGKYYHIDPTYTITYPDSLFFFGMNDLQREYYGDYPSREYTYADSDLFRHENYIADDGRFRDLWLAESYEIDHACRKIRLKDHNTGEIRGINY